METKKIYEGCIRKVLSQYLADSLIDSIIEDFEGSIFSMLDILKDYLADWLACKLYGEIGEMYLKEKNNEQIS